MTSIAPLISTHSLQTFRLWGGDPFRPGGPLAHIKLALVLNEAIAFGDEREAESFAVFLSKKGNLRPNSLAQVIQFRAPAYKSGALELAYGDDKLRARIDEFAKSLVRDRAPLRFRDMPYYPDQYILNYMTSVVSNAAKQTLVDLLSNEAVFFSGDDRDIARALSGMLAEPPKTLLDIVLPVPQMLGLSWHKIFKLREHSGIEDIRALYQMSQAEDAETKTEADRHLMEHLWPALLKRAPEPGDNFRRVLELMPLPGKTAYEIVKATAEATKDAAWQKQHRVASLAIELNRGTSRKHPYPKFALLNNPIAKAWLAHKIYTSHVH